MTFDKLGLIYISFKLLPALIALAAAIFVEVRKAL